MEGLEFAPILFQYATGAGTASAMGTSVLTAADPFNLVVGDHLDLTSDVLGTAPNPESASATSLVDGQIGITNNSSGDVTVFFDLIYAISADASAAEPGGFALSDASVVAVSEDLFEFVNESVSSFGDMDFSDGSMSLGPSAASFSLTVSAGDFDAVSVSVDSSGFASVPEPSALWLLVTTTGAMCAARRRS
jgi:hypothetical protein